MGESSELFRSYFDTTLGAVFFNIPAAELPEVIEMLNQARQLRKSSEEGRSAYISLLNSWLRLRHYPLMAHEWGHALQALTHPALYLRCLREFSAMSTISDELRKAPESAPVPLVPEQSWSEELIWPTVPVRIALDDDGSPIAEAAEGKPMPNDVSETDLLEASASIFEYKAEIGGEGSADLYQRWLQEGRKHLYGKTFRFVAAASSPADAYVAVTPLVMAAYTTTWPVHAFVSLLAATLKAPAPPREMGVDKLWRYLQVVLKQTLGTGAAPDPRRHLHQEREQRRLSRSTVIKLAREMPMHPLSPIVRLAWKDQPTIARLQEAMLHPYLAFSRARREHEEWLEPFRPAVTGFRMLDAGMAVGETPLYISPTVLDADLGSNQMEWHGYLIELLRLKPFVFAIATPFLRPLPHNCHHTSCPLHETDMCRGWIHVPARAEECGFPEWLAGTTGRRFDFNTKMLVPID